MRKILIIVSIALGLTSCGSVYSLYYWGGVSRDATTYENLTYNNYDKQTPESICALICMYEDMITNPRGSRLVPPPGICAEYGYMLFIPENAEIFKNYATKQQKSMFDTNDYALFFQERGKQMMLKEIELYPESAKFIAPLVERLSK